MLVKYRKEEHLIALRDKGEMFFSPCKKFRGIEEEQKQKGMGDINDGGTHFPAEKVCMTSSDGSRTVLNNANISLIMKPALNTPTFCLREAETEFVSASYREKLRNQFPEHTHALIIDDEEEFLEQVRYHFRSKAFAHNIFYQDNFLYDFWEFLKFGQSIIRFYPPTANQKYYSEMMYVRNSGEKEYLRIDDSNFYRTMFRKDLFFIDQQEMRIVLPYEKIDNGKPYYIGAIKANIVKIDDLVGD